MESIAVTVVVSTISFLDMILNTFLEYSHSFSILSVIATNRDKHNFACIRVVVNNMNLR